MMVGSTFQITDASSPREAWLAVLSRSGDIHTAGRLKMAWLKDPDGNVLALVSE